MNVLDIVLPIFLVIGAGAVLRRIGFFDETIGPTISRLVFYVAAPALLLRGTASESLDETFDPAALIVVVVVSLLVGGVTYAVCFRSRAERRGVIAQGAFRSNQVFIGLPLVVYAYGEDAVQAVAVLVGFTVILYNFLGAVLLILPHQDSTVRMTTLLARTARGVLRNPLILACLAGIAYSLTGLPLPVVADRTLALVGRAAAPMALLAVGSGLDFRRLRNDVTTTLLVSLTKTVAYPALVYVGLRIAGRTGPDLALPVLVMTAPAAVVGYVMARELGGDEKLAAATVIGSTALSLLTIAGWLVFLGRAG